MPRSCPNDLDQTLQAKRSTVKLGFRLLAYASERGQSTSRSRQVWI